MTEEVLDNKVPEQEHTTVETNEVSQVPPEREYSDVELQAMEMGWRPAEEFDGPDTKFKSAETFIEQKPLYDRIEAANRKAREVERLLKQNIEYSRQLAENEKAKELELLKYKRNEAVALADEEAFAEADKAYQTKLMTPANPIVEPTLDEDDVKAVAEFKERNKSWMNNDTEEGKRLTQAAAAMCSFYEQDLPGKSSREYLAMVEKHIKTLAPHRFKNSARDLPSAVGSSRSTAPNSTDRVSSSDMAKLSQLQQHQMRVFVESGGKKEEYVQMLKQLKRI